MDAAKPCEDNYLVYGHKLDLDHRRKINELVDHMSRVIVAAVYEADQADASDKRIVFHDWDGIYSENNRRYCEPDHDWKTYAWFLTVGRNDEELSGAVIPYGTNMGGQSPVDLQTQLPICRATPPTDEAGQRICLLAEATSGGSIVTEIGTSVYPDGPIQFMHPKSAAHQTLANSIYKSMGY